MNRTLDLNRRDALRALGALGALAATSTLPSLGRAAAAASSEGAAFDAAVARHAAGSCRSRASNDADPRARRPALRLARHHRPLAGRPARPLLSQRTGPLRARRPALPPLVRRRRHGPAVHLLGPRRFAPSAAWCARPSSPPSARPAAFSSATFGTDDPAARRRSRARTRSTSPTPMRSSMPAGCWRCGKAARPSRSTRKTSRRPAPVTWKEGYEQMPFSAHPEARRRRPPVEHRHLRRQARRLAHRCRRQARRACRSSESAVRERHGARRGGHARATSSCRCRRCKHELRRDRPGRDARAGLRVREERAAAHPRHEQGRHRASGASSSCRRRWSSTSATPTSGPTARSRSPSSALPTTSS